MDAVQLTILSTAALAGLVPVYAFVCWRYFRAWRGGETIPYFAPTLYLILSIGAAATIVLFVAACTLIARVTGNTVLAPGIGLLLVVLAIFAPAPGMVWLLSLLVGRRQ